MLDHRRFLFDGLFSLHGFGSRKDGIKIFRRAYFAAAVVWITGLIRGQPKQMWEEIGWASKALPAAGGMSVEICVLSVVSASCVCLCLHLELPVFFGLLDVFVQAVALRECRQNAAIVCRAV